MSEIDHSLESAYGNPGGFGNLGNVAEDVAGASTAEAANAYLRANQIADNAFTSAASAGMKSAATIGMALGAGVTAVGLKVLHNSLNGSLGRIPIVGPPVTPLLNHFFSPVPGLLHWSADRLNDAVAGAIQHWTDVFQATTNYLYPGLSQAPQNYISKTEAAHLQAEINKTNSRIDALNNNVLALNAGIYPSAVPSPQTTTLDDRVTRVETHLVTIAHDVNVNHSDITSLQSTVAEMQTRLHRLEQNYQQTRTEQVGVQDTLAEFSTDLNFLITQANDIQAQTQANTDQLHILSPLDALLYLGSPGIKTLQRLEENPCQCPTLGNLGNPLWDALIADQVILNGI